MFLIATEDRVGKLILIPVIWKSLDYKYLTVNCVSFICNTDGGDSLRYKKHEAIIDILNRASVLDNAKI